MAERLLEGEIEPLIQTVLEKARDGDVACLRMVLDRLVPARKGRPIELDLPPIKSSEDVLSAIAAVWNAIGQGQVTPDEAGALSLLAGRSLDLIQMQNVLKRIDQLEQKRWPSDET
jgi:hypothetical protein